MAPAVIVRWVTGPLRISIFFLEIESSQDSDDTFEEKHYIVERMDFEFFVESPSQVPLILILVNEFVALAEVFYLSDIVND